VDRSAVVARGDAPEVFELVEEALDAVPEPVGDRIMRDLDLARAGRGNDRLGFSLGDQLAQSVAVISLVGNDAAAFEIRQKLRRGGAVVGFSAGQDEAKRPPLSIGQSVDLGRQSSSGTPQSLIRSPPFPVAACW
jgi:hypothetical protein